MVGALREIHIYPVHGEPGQHLDSSVVEADGLEGDRRKKAAVHVIAADEAPGTRANLVVTLTADELAAGIGGTLRVGEVELTLTGAPSSCPGVYAAVARPGVLRVGDGVGVTPRQAGA
jgi:uncharacterized protein YcbX